MKSGALIVAETEAPIWQTHTLQHEVAKCLARSGKSTRSSSTRK